MDITLEDVEVAIRVLYEFLKRQRQAQSLLARLGVGRERGGFAGLSMEQIWNMAYQQVMAQKGISVESKPEEEPQVSEADLKRMREIAERLKQSKQ
ncbi:MAG: hypothetical protein KIH10_16340 [Candidatus Freyarchaeota archaeon]|nr:hypothetical protein [Candidatus Jordarchaeia archaeon]MBS7281145.1 hypothetical protein [Candidatus Jordarchaeia archaeon]